MIIEIKAPRPGESVSEVEIAGWLADDGDIVFKDQEIAEIESEKATLPLIAEETGQLHILKSEGERVSVGTVVGTIDTSKKGDAGMKVKTKSEPEIPVKKSIPEKERSKEAGQEEEVLSATKKDEYAKVKITPLAARMMKEYNLSVGDVINGLKKITSNDIRSLKGREVKETPSLHKTRKGSRNENRTRISLLRKKLSERLVAVKNETAMLTTFNEVDMSRVISLRQQHQDDFMKAHGIKLGFMSFFTKASAIALIDFPMVNSRIEGEEIITPSYCDIGIAVQTEKGLMVPVIRNAEVLSLPEIEKEIDVLAGKARNNRLSIEEMNGGTFTITNGGIFGSMMSTPIINPPQAAILGMHRIAERPVVIEGRIVVRPMMYLALSYDHRIIDGRDSVGFLVRIKEIIENPSFQEFV